MIVTALIVAAGKGERLGGGIPKQYHEIGGKPVLRWAVEALARHPVVDAVRVVIGEEHTAAFHQATAGLDVGTPIIGGATRQESARRGLEALEAVAPPDRVLIHDAARPFCPLGVIDRLLKALRTNEAAVPALPVADTLMSGKGRQLGISVDRTHLNRVQTPQAFHFARILEAHRLKASERFSDDATLARAAYVPVMRVEGDEALAKLTYPGDFARAEVWLASRLVPRTGMGFDVHAFSGEGPIMLGGIAVPHSRGLAGHSDADVILHAITDALLGSAGLGDIGEHFPPSNPQWKGASSDLFLRHAVQLLRSKGAIIDHVDCTIIAEEPKVGPHRQAMREKIAQIAGLRPDQVSVKATTTDGLGFTGRREGIAAQAVASIRMGPFA